MKTQGHFYPKLCMKSNCETQDKMGKELLSLQDHSTSIPETKVMVAEKVEKYFYILLLKRWTDRGLRQMDEWNKEVGRSVQNLNKEVRKLN